MHATQASKQAKPATRLWEARRTHRGGKQARPGQTYIATDTQQNTHSTYIYKKQ